MVLRSRVVRSAGVKLGDRQVERLQKAAEKAEQAQAKIEKRKEEWSQLWVLCCTTSLSLESCASLSGYILFCMFNPIQNACLVYEEVSCEHVLWLLWHWCWNTEHWRLSYAEKPDEDCEDPQDVEAIRIARETIGDLKLKSAKDYDVPKHLRMNPEGKREQLKGLEEKVETHADILWCMFSSLM